MTTLETLAPVVVGPDGDRSPQTLQMDGVQMLIKAVGEDTGGQFSVLYAKVEPMTGPPLHMHTREDEWFYILKGTICIQVGDQFIEAGPGTSAFAPRNIPHTWQNFGPEPAELLALVTPAGFEHFFVDRMKAGDDLPAQMVLAQRYGTRFLGAPLTERKAR